jgi:hypothetical protein
MALPLVDQLRFARSEFKRGLRSVRDPEAQQRFGSMNCISWIVGHLAWQEQRTWLTRPQGLILVPNLNQQVANGGPASTPPAEEMWAAWELVTEAADPWLDALTLATIQSPLSEGFSSAGTFIQRVCYHYWYHLGEGMAVRQMLGHTRLPQYVGNIDGIAPYRPESIDRAPRISMVEFIEKVRAGRAQIDALINALDETRMEEAIDGDGWTVKDVIAHLTWYEREMVGMLQRHNLAGSELWNASTDERNRVITAENHERPLGEVRAESGMVFRQLVETLESLDEEDLHKPARFADMPSDWRPWQILAENTYEHYVAHVPALAAFVDKTQS